MTDAAVLSGQPLPAKQLLEPFFCFFFFFLKGGVAQGVRRHDDYAAELFTICRNQQLLCAPGRTAAFLRGDILQIPAVEYFFFMALRVLLAEIPL